MCLDSLKRERQRHRRDAPEVAKLWLRLVLMQLTRDLFAIAKFLLSNVNAKRLHRHVVAVADNE